VPTPPLFDPLQTLEQGDSSRISEVFSQVYKDLHRLASARIRGENELFTLETTDLLHELYLKLSSGNTFSWRTQAHFFAIASNAMRHILIDQARARASGKRGNAQRALQLNHAQIPVEDRAMALLELDDALNQLAKRHPKMAQLVELKYFGGLNLPEIAEIIEVSPRTAERLWMRAKAYIASLLSYPSDKQIHG